MIKKTKKFIVYQIKVDGVIRYIGRTNDIKRRTRDHNNGVMDMLNNKELYVKTRKILEYSPYYSGPIKPLILEPLFDYSTKIESKRKEMFLILQHYFVNRDQLWQKVPNISDR